MTISMVGMPHLCPGKHCAVCRYVKAREEQQAKAGETCKKY